MLKDLSPTQRAFLKLIEALGWTIAINVVFAIGTYLSNNATIDWKALSFFAGAQALLAVLLAVSKYFRANGQPLLSTAIDQAAQELVKRSGVNPVLEEQAERAQEPQRWRPVGDDWSKRRPQEGG